jgi:hypothetical protein
VLLYDVSKLKYASSKAVVAQALSVHGHVSHTDTKHIGTFCTPDYIKYAARVSKRVLSNDNKIQVAMNWLARKSAKDPLGGDSFQTLIAISAIGNGLPIHMASNILAENTTPAVLAKEVASLDYTPLFFEQKAPVESTTTVKKKAQ